jgi:PhzF family phenazine biosynthesis protein
VAFDTLGGPLRAEVEARPDGPLVWLEPALPACRPLPGPPADVRDALGLAAGSVAAWAPVVTTPERDLVVPLTGLDVLLGLSPDHARLAAATRGAGLRGVCLVSRQVREPGAAIHSRFLAPGVGIPEDPVTGSVHASLAVWLDGAGLLEPGAPRVTFRAEQGDAVGRPGRLLVEVWRAGGGPARVRVGGQAVTVLTGHVLLP